MLWRQAARLQLPRTQESMLLPDHMFSRAAAALEDDDKVRAAAHGGSLRTTALPGCVVFGLAAIDRSDETSRFAIDTQRGRPVLDAGFDLSDADTQRALLGLSAALPREPCELRLCRPPTLVREGAPLFFLEAWRRHNVEVAAQKEEKARQQRERARRHSTNTTGLTKDGGGSGAGGGAGPSGADSVADGGAGRGGSGGSGGGDASVRDAPLFDPSPPVTGLPSGHRGNFTVAIHSWLASSRGAPYRSQVGFIDSELAFLCLPFLTTYSYPQATWLDWLELRALWDTVLSRLLADAPPPLRRAFPIVYQEASRKETGRVLVSAFAVASLYPRLFHALSSSLAAAFALCYVIVAVATRSLALASLATATVAGVIGSVLGAAQLCGHERCRSPPVAHPGRRLRTRRVAPVSLRVGVELGIREMCGVAVMAGFSFDYALHLATAYRAAPPSRAGKSPTREERVAFAAVHMGPTLCAASPLSASKCALAPKLRLLRIGSAARSPPAARCSSCLGASSPFCSRSPTW